MAKRAERPSWFKLFLVTKPILTAVPDENLGKGMKAALAYFEDRSYDSNELDPLTFAVFNSLKPYIDDAYDDFNRRVENGKAGGRPPKPQVTTGNQWLPLQTEEEEEEEEEERSNSFIHSVHEEREVVDNGDISLDEPEARRRYLGGIGKNMVFLSDNQMSDLLDRLSIEEFDKYVGIIADCELKGQHYRKKTHYQAILDMAKKDRKIK